MFSKIEFPSTAIRFLTLACYFLPFVFFFSTCVDGVSKEAFNKEEAIANEKEKIKVEKKDLIGNAAGAIADLVMPIDSTANTELNSETITMIANSGDTWYLTPTYTSLSAVGVGFMFKNAFGQILVALSALLSLITFFLWRFLNRKRIALYFIGVNLFVMFVFILMCLLMNVTVLYGAYSLVFLLTVQLLTELQKRKKINTTLVDINPN